MVCFVASKYGKRSGLKNLQGKPYVMNSIVGDCARINERIQKRKKQQGNRSINGTSIPLQTQDKCQ